MPSEIQAAYALVPEWNARSLRAWLRLHGLTPIKRAHRVGSEIRYRLAPPELYRRYRTKVLPNGVYLVFGYRAN